MDPMSVGGLALGVTSLAFDVFDHSIKLFQFFASIIDMPKECERHRLQLMIEYNRLLAWGDAVGLVDVPDGSHLASSLGTNAFELCTIIARIGGLLEEFKELNDRWKNEGQAYPLSDRPLAEEEAQKTDFRVQVSSLALSYEEGRQRRMQPRRLRRITARLYKGAENAKEVISHPFRARWVTMDKTVFEALLRELHSLIERIHGLMSDYHEKKVHENTAKTYREMVVVSNDLHELKDMFQAVIDMMEISRSVCIEKSDQNGNSETLRDLLRLKKIQRISDEILLRAKNDAEVDIERDLKDIVNVGRYDGALFDPLFRQNLEASTDATLDPRRSRGVLTEAGKEYEVWLEWRTAEKTMEGSAEGNESILRIAALAQMLSVNKPQHLFSPTCIGYVDDRKRQNRFGWIFQMPQGSHRGTLLKTLRSMLGSRLHKPTLTQRVSLARKMASSLLYIHAADWLHKGVHSGNVVFACDRDQLDFELPILSGFEYSRPQTEGTTSRSLDPKWDIYRWPGIQSEMPRAENSRKTYDIYSLGLLLLEIAHWQPLNELLSLKRWPEPSPHQDCRIRGWLLDEEPFPPFKDENPLLALRNIAGDKYWEATKHCIAAHGEHGMRIQEHVEQSQPENGLELQDAFSELVVKNLKTVSV
ncbi:hypothetical protein LTR86_011078 [Recurvomyces mirabilis]|nr:hypothetical protein LTR86_011078 [Recurvomyces mirabilis]